MTYIWAATRSTGMRLFALAICALCQRASGMSTTLFGAKWVKLRCSDVFDNRLSPRRYVLETLYKHRLCAIWPAQHCVFVGPDECPNRAILRDDEHGTSFACMGKVDS